LTSKGFVEDETRHHRYFVLTIDGVESEIRTRYSHGAKECGDYHLGEMAKQLHLSRHQLDQLIDCSLSGDQYIEILKNAGHIKLLGERG